MSRHRAVFTTLVQRQGWQAGAELGVDKGILFRQLLTACPALSLIGVDICPVPERREKCQAIAKEFAERAAFHVMTTLDAATMVPDRSLDFVFIDADHSEAAVQADIEAWQPKVKRWGWLGGHDYNPKTFPGVVRAVDRTFNGSVRTWPGSIWGVWQ